MTREKVKMSFIKNDTQRKSTFKKRKKGLMKKAQELATLCDVKTCAIVYSPYESTPDVWPSSDAARQVLTDWLAFPGTERTKKMVNQESFTRQRLSKISDSYKKLEKENKEMEMKDIIFKSFEGVPSLSHLGFDGLQDLGNVIDQYLKDINRRLEVFSMNDSHSFASLSASSSALVAIDSTSSPASSSASASALASTSASASASTSASTSVFLENTTRSGVITVAEMNSTSIKLYDRIRYQIQNQSNINEMNKDINLDLNK